MSRWSSSACSLHSRSCLLSSSTSSLITASCTVFRDKAIRLKVLRVDSFAIASNKLKGGDSRQAQTRSSFPPMLSDFHIFLRSASRTTLTW